MHEGLDALTST